MPLTRRILIDTNVLVAALLHPDRTPDRALEAILAGDFRVVYDARIEAEYREVLGRAKLASIPRERRERLLDRLLDGAEAITARPYLGALIDEGDRSFVEVCRTGLAHVLLTGNTKHFPRDLGFLVLTPAELCADVGVAIAP